MAKPGERPKSDWAVPERLGGLKVERAEDDSGGVGGHVLMVGEAERIIENLKQFDIADVGSRAWMEQHASMEKLNQQAHASARDKSDEFVLEAFLTFDKLPTLVYDLILSEQWREKVYPYLEADIVGASEDRESEATRAKCMRCYFVLFHETTVVNLLECLCYHAHAVGNVRDAALDLTDYCARRLAALHSKAKLFRAAKPAKDAAQSPGDFARSLEKRSAKEELDQQSLEIEFSASVSCVALVRMVVEHLGELTVAGMSRLLETHDFLLSIVPLLEHPPWTRARYERVDADDDSDEPKKKRVWQKLQEGDWKDVPTDRLLDVTKLEAQAWLALYHLTLHPEVRKRYGFDAYRKQTLLRARRFINDVLLDQLPVLADLQRFMDELAIVAAPEPTAVGDSGCLLQQVAAFHEAINRKADFEAVAKRQLETIWASADVASDDLKQLVEVYAGDAALGLDDDAAGSIANSVGALDLDKLMKDLDGKQAAPDGENDARAANVAVPTTPPVALHLEDARGASPARPSVAATPSPGDAKVVAADDGATFLRRKWTLDGPVKCAGDDGLVLRVCFAGGVERALASGPLGLPGALDPPPPKKLWRQLGAVADGLAAQVLLKCDVPLPGATAPTYRADALFVSTPAP